MLISEDSFEAYTNRFKRMVEHKFSKKGSELFLKTYRAESEQVRNLHVRAKINGRWIDNDEPESLGGTDKAATPMETLLASLANCLEISALLFFSFSKLKVDSVKINVEGTFDQRAILKGEEAPLPGFFNIKYYWKIKSKEPRQKILQVIKKVNENCPVKATFQNEQEYLESIDIKREY